MPGWQGRGLVNGVNKRTAFQQRLALLHHCSLALCFFSVFFYIKIYLLFVCVCAGMFAPKCVCLGQKTTFESQCSPYTVDSSVARLAGQVPLLLNEFTNHASCFLILLQKGWVEMLSNYDIYTQT